jgi:hypothetical protein
MSAESTRDAIDLLRRDALDREMLDLAVVYGWSQIRINETIIGRKMTELELYQQTTRPRRIS